MSKITIFKGDDVNITVVLQDEDGKSVNLDTVDGTGGTEITANFPYSGGCLTKTLSGGGITKSNSGGGEIVIALAEADTQLLDVSKTGNFEVVLAAPAKSTVQFEKVLNVKDRYC